jgi:hypothetical protein
MTALLDELPRRDAPGVTQDIAAAGAAQPAAAAASDP